MRVVAALVLSLVVLGSLGCSGSAPVVRRLGNESPPGGPPVLSAPFFRGYLDVPAVAAVARGQVLDASLLAPLLDDAHADEAAALVNAAGALARPALRSIEVIVLEAILRHHDEAGLGKPERTADLTGAEAFVLGYVRSLTELDPASEGTDDGSFAAASATRLLRHARKRLAARAPLCGVLVLAHNLERTRWRDPCRASDAADEVFFVVKRSALPEGAKSALREGLEGVVVGCRQ
jgi:hypothetical protein